jgi:hypothetical protein
MELLKKSYVAPIFSEFWAGRAVKYTLWEKFSGPAQRGGKAGLERGGARSNARSL